MFHSIRAPAHPDSGVSLMEMEWYLAATAGQALNCPGVSAVSQRRDLWPHNYQKAVTMAHRCEWGIVGELSLVAKKINTQWENVQK